MRERIIIKDYFWNFFFLDFFTFLGNSVCYSRKRKECSNTKKTNKRVMVFGSIAIVLNRFEKK